MRLPSGENDGSRSSVGSLVSRMGAPPVICWTQISRLPDRSDAYASSMPSGEIAGSTVNPLSNVMRVSTGMAVGGKRAVCHCAPITIAAMTAADASAPPIQ
jgi:hypothetical protein